MTKVFQCALVASLFALTGCNNKAEVVSAGGDSMLATLKANEQFAQELKLEDQQDFEDAKRGFIARPEGKILDTNGGVLIDFDEFKFVEGKAPPTVNPSLWRHAILNAQIGLFKVTDGIYQLRGFDVANITLIEGKSGWIVVDALTCRESAAAAMAFARKHLGEKAGFGNRIHAQPHRPFRGRTGRCIGQGSRRNGKFQSSLLTALWRKLRART
jgi:alkyl sulfatase BDS1-like metallo-beta-lactamase superfamily hydrolase